GNVAACKNQVGAPGQAGAHGAQNLAQAFVGVDTRHPFAHAVGQMKIGNLCNQHRAVGAGRQAQGVFHSVSRTNRVAARRHYRCKASGKALWAAGRFAAERESYKERPLIRRISTITMATTIRMWMNPPMVYDVTRPRSQRINRMTAIV